MVIDLHSHILPGVDDGSESMEQSLWMLRQAADSGIDYMVATPHYHPRQTMPRDELRWIFDRLQEAAYYEEIPVKLSLAMEIYATDDLPELLEKGSVWTYPDSSWFLVEFAPDEKLGYMNELLEQCAQRGYKPLIAHPERYYNVWSDPQVAKQWLDQGYGVQVDRDSLMGGFGDHSWRCADYLARNGWISCFASDAHSHQMRSGDWQKVFPELYRKFGFRTLGRWLETFPEQLLKI